MKPTRNKALTTQKKGEIKMRSKIMLTIFYLLITTAEFAAFAFTAASTDIVRWGENGRSGAAFLWFVTTVVYIILLAVLAAGKKIDL